MRKLLIIPFFYSFFLFFFIYPAYAENQQFKVSFDVIYSINESGNTHVVFNGELTNTSEGFYASSYSLQTGLNKIDNVLARDQNGQIIPQVKSTDTGELITLLFNTKAIGLNKSISYVFSFDTPNVAKNLGNIWEVNIPGISNANEFTKFTVHLQIPQSFGAPRYVKPQSAGNILDFSKDSLGASGISLAFGNNQTYSFTLHYHLKNQQIFPLDSTIALPPSTGYQDVYLNSINPKPKSIKKDKDGNFLAVYRLLPSQKINITIEGNANINLFPKKENLSNEDRQIYLQEKKYWEQSDSIKKLAQELQTPKNIYDYVVQHLSYDFSRVVGVQKRIGAEGVLKNPNSAVCLEFTDLFIALSRSAGIPAREIDGYAFTQNTKERPLSLLKDVLHAWPEYYDDSRKAWIMVDPTWANTTRGVDYFNILDFDHFAFSIKGTESNFPIPAGGYKISGSEKDVFVSFIKTPVLTNYKNITTILKEQKNSNKINTYSSLLQGGNLLFIGGLLIALSCIIVFIFAIKTRGIRL